MSIESILKDNELLLMQRKQTDSGKQVYAIDTSQHSAYDNSYMLITVDEDKEADIMYAYLSDVTDLFYYYDLIK
jgi:hypothetical protein